MEELSAQILVGDKMQNIFINRPIRRLIIHLHKTDMFYSNPQKDKEEREIISNITQDEEIFNNTGNEVFYLWRKNKYGSYCWKKIINMPVIVEYDDEISENEYIEAGKAFIKK